MTLTTTTVLLMLLGFAGAPPQSVTTPVVILVREGSGITNPDGSVTFTLKSGSKLTVPADDLDLSATAKLDAPPPPAPAPPALPASAPALTVASPRAETSWEQLWHIVSSDSRITEINEVFARFAWTLTLSSAYPVSTAYHAVMEFQDKDGTVLDSESVDVELRPYETRTLVGDTLIRRGPADRVARRQPKVTRIR